MSDMDSRLRAVSTDVEALKNKVSKLNQEKSKLEGRYEAAIARLKELGFDGIAEAEAYVEEENKRLDAAISELETDVATFKEQYKDFLDRV